MMRTADDDLEFGVDDQQLNDCDLPASHRSRVNGGSTKSWKKVAFVATSVVAVVCILVPVAVRTSQAMGVDSNVNEGPTSYEPIATEQNSVDDMLSDRPIESAPPVKEDKDDEGKVESERTQEVTVPPAIQAWVQHDNQEPPASSTQDQEEIPLSLVRTQNACPALDSSVAAYRHADGEYNATWTQIGADLLGEGARDSSGLTLDMSADGSIVAIGTSQNEGENRTSSGHVRVFQYDPEDGVYYKLGQDVDGENSRDWFGSSLSMDASGRRFAAGAVFADDGALWNAGYVKVFDYNEMTKRWEQVGNTIVGQERGDQLGAAVSLSADGTRLAVGATYADAAGEAEDVGHVYIFDLVDGDTWKPIGVVVGAGKEDYFGKTVALSADGTHLAVGSPMYDSPRGNQNVGLVQVYHLDQSTGTDQWIPLGEGITSTNTNQQTGSALAISDDGSHVAVGFPHISFSAFPSPGTTRIFGFDSDSGMWEQVGQDLVGSDSISLSHTRRVAVGDVRDLSNGMDAGVVRVYDFDVKSDEWKLLGEEIYGDRLDISGTATVLSADGSRVAISSPRASYGNVVEVGKTRVYDLC